MRGVIEAAPTTVCLWNPFDGQILGGLLYWRGLTLRRKREVETRVLRTEDALAHIW